MEFKAENFRILISQQELSLKKSEGGLQQPFNELAKNDPLGLNTTACPMESAKKMKTLLCAGNSM